MVTTLCSGKARPTFSSMSPRTTCTLGARAFSSVNRKEKKVGGWKEVGGWMGGWVRGRTVQLLPGDEVAGAQDVLHFVGHEHALEFLGEDAGPVRDVEVAEDEDEFPEFCHGSIVFVFVWSGLLRAVDMEHRGVSECLVGQRGSTNGRGPGGRSSGLPVC